MDRREAIRRVTILMGGAVVGANLFLEGCTQPITKTVEVLFEESNIDLLNELAEAILPRTSTPGAGDANVGSFIPVMIRDCYSEADQKAFVDGLKEIDNCAKRDFGRRFQDLTKEERFAFVDAQDREAKVFQNNRKAELKLVEEKLKKEGGKEMNRFAFKKKMDNIKEDTANHFFTLLKQLTLTGYFTSEVGMTKALRFVKVPGKFDGDYPYSKGERAWAI